MEFGARALGNRSILATPRDPEMRTKLNYVIKKREGFRPFAPSTLKGEDKKWFEVREDIPYMNQVVKVKERFRKQLDGIKDKIAQQKKERQDFRDTRLNPGGVETVLTGLPGAAARYFFPELYADAAEWFTGRTTEEDK